MVFLAELPKRRLPSRPEPHRMRMRPCPWTTCLTIAAVPSVLVATFLIPEQRPLPVASLISFGMIL
jgi:L-asparagine transporter-like permease